MSKQIVPILLAVALIVSGLLSITAIHGLQGNARVINYAGVVRGATQRLVKQELSGQPNDILVVRLDGILTELSTGEGENELTKLEDDAFQELISQMQEQWTQIKSEILQVRKGAETGRLYQLSEDYFTLADRTVTAAEVYSERQIRRAEQILILLSAVILLLAALLAWYGTVQGKRQKALEEAEKENRVKRENLDRMSEDLRAPMDEISELMYVSDLVTYDLLFLNEAGRKTFGVTELTGKKCYQVLQGKSAPCEFCTTPCLIPGENYTWELTNPVSKRHYMLKDRLVQWEGRSARLEIAFDMTEAEEEKQNLKSMLNTEQVIMECVRILYKEHDLNQSVPRVLEHLGNFLSSGRVYLARLRDDFLYSDFEWCAPGLSSRKAVLQAVPLSSISSWLPVFLRQECIVIENMDVMKEKYPEEYKLFCLQETDSLVVAPIEQEGQICGLLGVDNPPPERVQNITLLLQTLCYFLTLTYRRSENEQQLSQLSYFDTLTSFYNRNRFMKDSEIMSSSDSPVGIVYLDVNGLKDINDTLGHAYGDKILADCAQQMRDIFRDANYYRIGGDEFVIICPGIGKEDFQNNVLVLRRQFEKNPLCKAAVGAQWNLQYQDLQQVIASADAKMYEDKKDFYRRNPKSNRYRHHSDEVLQLSDPNVLQTEICQERFVVYFQPKISSADRTIVGAEALIRYQSRSGSLVLPGNFLPLLEENRTVSRIDFYVFEYACSRLKKWAAQGKQTVPVSVNFSRSSLSQPDFVKKLSGLCQKYGVDKKYLEIELTETAQEDEAVDLKSLIHELRQDGFTVSIDDFGTEFANLSLLSAVEFDVLKLDSSLVEDVGFNLRAQTVVKTIVGICKEMHIEVVAEGIETEDQLTALRACGVELAQGYLFSKPISMEEYENKYL